MVHFGRERYNFRTLLVGEEDIGETNLALRFSVRYCLYFLYGTDCCIRKINFFPNSPNNELKVRTIDICGHAYFICFDITNMHSFGQSKKWYSKSSRTNGNQLFKKKVCWIPKKKKNFSFQLWLS